MSPRLPQPGGDSGNWGEILNEYLSVEHKADGKLRQDTSLAAKADLDDFEVLVTRVSGSIASDGSLTDAAIDQAADEITQRLTRGNTFVALGDSITRSDEGRYTASTNAAGGRVYHTHMTWYTGGRLIPVAPTEANIQQANMGVGGERSDQILLRVPSVIAANPDYCLVCVGANDGGADVSLSAFSGNMINILRELQDGNVTPIVVTPPPHNTPSVAGRIRTYIAWLKEYCNSKGILCIDTWQNTVNPATGAWKTGYDIGDGIHPDHQGAAVMGRLVADAVLPLLASSTSPYLTAFSSDPANLLSNGVFEGDANSDGVADGWQRSGNSIGSLEPADLGTRQLITFGSDNTLGGSINQIISTGFSAGDRLAFSAIFSSEIDMIPNHNHSFSIILQFQSSGGIVLGEMTAFWSLETNVNRGVCYREGVVPVGTGRIRIFIGTSGAAQGTLSVERATLVNLTKMHP